MKTLIQIILLCLLSNQTIQAQNKSNFMDDEPRDTIMLKWGFLPKVETGGATIVLDFGIGFKINKRWGFDISTTYKGYGGESGEEKIFRLSPQLKYYFKRGWLNSPYIGSVLQYNRLNSFITDNSDGTKLKQVFYEKYGTGIILGHTLKLYKGWGFDFHVGLIGELGNVNTVTRASTLAPEIGNFEKNKVNARFFWGINLYSCLY
jgi:Protein of unknown function (DUF3575)